MATTRSQSAAAPPGAALKVASAVSAALGLALFVGLTWACMPYFEGVMRACSEPGALSEDQFPRAFAERWGLGWMCLPHRFLEDAAGMSAGDRLATASLNNLFAPLAALWVVESIKPGAKWAVRWLALPAVMGVTMAISVALPLAWLPSYWLGQGGRPAAGGAPPLAQLAAAAGASLAFGTVLALVHHGRMGAGGPMLAYTTVVALFLGAMPAVGLAVAPLARLCPSERVRGWAQAPTRAADQAAAHAAAARLHMCMAGMMGLHHALNVCAFAEAGLPWGDFGENVRRRGEPAWQAAYFLLWDAVALWAGAAAFVGGEGGWGAAAAYAAQSVLVGPGTALALHASAREGALGAAAGGARFRKRD